MASPRAKVDVQTLKVEDVLVRLREGSIRVPEFQRPLKWSREDNRLFFDSLLRGYPVGSLLVWVRPEEAGPVRLGPYETEAPGHSHAWRVVDGQQRLTALAGGLLPISNRPADFDFVVDITTGRVASPRDELGVSQVPLRVLGDIDSLVPWLHEHPRLDVRTAAEYSKRLREYPLSVIVLDVNDQSFVEDVFKRLNRSGKKLTQAEVFRASHGRRPAGRALTRAMAVGRELRFGSLDESNLLRALKVSSGRDPLADLEEPAPENADDLVRGTREAVVMLKHTGVPSSELIPFSLPFGVLVAFFARHREVSARNRQLLDFWFWRATLSFKLKGDFTSIRDLYARAVKDDEHEAVQALLAAVPNGFSGLDSQASFTLGSAAGKVLVLLLLSRGPRHLETGERLPVGQLLERAPLKSLMQPVARSVTGFGVPNTVFHPRLGRGQVRRALEQMNHEIASSHLLPSPFEDTRDWVEMRTSILKEALEQFVESKAGVLESTRPALVALGDPSS